METDGATIANMACGVLPWRRRRPESATRTVNCDGCHEAMMLKRTYHDSSSDRRHHRFLEVLRGGDVHISQCIYIQVEWV